MGLSVVECIGSFIYVHLYRMINFFNRNYHYDIKKRFLFDLKFNQQQVRYLGMTIATEKNQHFILERRQVETVRKEAKNVYLRYHF